MKAVLIALCVASVSLATRASLLATDNAGNYTAWNNGDNFGSGFGAWSLNGAGANSGFFIGNSANNAGGSSGNINSGGNKAWGMYAYNNATVSAVRPFSGGSLGVGQQLLIRMDNGFIQNGGSVGFGLQNSSGANRFEFYFVGGDSSYTINIGGTTTSTGIGFTGNGLSLVFSQNAANGYSLDVTPAGGSASHFSGTLAASDISQLRLFNFNAASAGLQPNNDAFFNDIQVVPEPINIALGVFGALAVGSFGVRRFLSGRST